MGRLSSHSVRISFILLPLAIAAAMRPTPGGARGEGEILRNALVSGVAMGIPGLSVAIGQGDSLAWRGTAGYSDLSRKVPVQPNDRFGIGSITKTFVAHVILQLVQEGKLDLAKTPMDYLDLDVVRQVPNTDQATLRQLLNHQSGIPTWEFQPEWIRTGRGDRMQLGHIWEKTETLPYVARDHFAAEDAPGMRYAYSNTNYTILGLVIEAVTGNDVMAEIRKRVLEPLHLKNTFLESFEQIPGGYVHHYHYATPHFQQVAGVHRGFTEARPYLVESTAANLSPEWTAGGMVSTASDLVRWAQAIRKAELLQPAMQKELFTYYAPTESSNGRVEYMQGVMRLKDYFEGHTVLGHSGGTLGFTAMMFWLGGTDTTVVLLTNVGGMHSGLRPSPVSLFYREVLLPAVMQYLQN